MAIIIEFLGGYHDGGQLSSESGDEQEATLTRRLYFRSTGGGTIGKQFRVVADAAVEFQWTGGDESLPRARFCFLEYEVADRIERGGDIIVQCRYVSAVNELA